jgi:hypothetical protein
MEVLCGLLSGGALFAIMALTFFDVLGRKFLDNSIPGSLELTELLMVVVIFGALPLVSRAASTSSSIRSTPTCLPGCGAAGRAGAPAVRGVLLLLAVLMWRTGTQFLQNGETTAQLLILKAPFIYGMAHAVRHHRHRAPRDAARPPAEDKAEGEGAAL